MECEEIMSFMMSIYYQLMFGWLKGNGIKLLETYKVLLEYEINL